MEKQTIDRIHKFVEDRDWQQFHTPANLAKSISIEANELLECFQWSDTDYDIGHVKEELADVLVYCRNLLDALGLDEDEIINAKMDQNEVKYPTEKAKGSSAKYDQFEDEPKAEEMVQADNGEYEFQNRVLLEEPTIFNQIDRLSCYELQPNEYNMALMLLYYYKNKPDYYTLLTLDRLLEKKAGIGHEIDREICDSYKHIKRQFTSSLNIERRKIGSYDTTIVASRTEKDSAANFLMMFRGSEEEKFAGGFVGNSPNLGNVRRVDCMEVANNPGSGYMEFLADWRLRLQIRIQLRSVNRD